MDPTATLAELLDALIANDRHTAAGAARDLADWLDRGGFLPDLIAGATVSAVERAYRLAHD